MKWLDLLAEIAGPIIGAIAKIAGDKWDPEEAAAKLAELARNPPRQAISDPDRDALRDLTGSD